MVPHVVVWGSGLSQKTSFMWAIAATSRASSPESGCLTPTLVGPGHACGRTHDAGPHPGHIWPNALLPLILLGSASKAEFGSGTVKTAIAPQAGGSADMGINVLYILNANLDCQDFPLPPAPFGMCFTTNYMVRAGFSIFDLLRGLFQMIADALVTWAVGAFCAAFSAALSGLLGKSFVSTFLESLRGGSERLGGVVDGVAIRSAQGLMADGAGFFASNGRLFVDGWRSVPAALATVWRSAPADQVAGLAGTALGAFGLGTPIGYAPKNAPIGGWNPAPNSTFNSTYSSWIDGWHR
jgi:hypothetical protein